ncbi:structural maintenance of chromosomes protein [Chloropicon primus]|uniref:Structural maintenance of chromosomes protein n=2 Tax=Chloropicon primus TaxID=1764295 RepID=A0A5B8MGJ0_9CHLO|nr:structural maintenance of chromosomes protein [Chloropicon primus]UPQ97671.1 structural maintenance of chromosomes protein [Chloropicon primus]|eukprot:QDZ18462.1 structural maintenance of chromosomes protein [Chloropicon primus]
MFVKQVVIEGFLTYKDQTALEYFDPKVNTVVGPNGSGKSNFFKAIRFVLGDLLSTSRSEERRGLLHEGVGHGSSSAYVELVLDNSDGRIPVESSEVRLRRTITLKKDEYSLERKHVTKTEVVNLLESAGFSRANPYYIVQQGKIRDLAVMTDKARLELLKEVGGTKIYEERRKESLDLMKDAGAKKKEIEDMLNFFEDKVSELEGDKEELVNYLNLDKQRRVVEYSIFDRDLQTTNASLQKIEKQREVIVSKSNTAYEEASRAKVNRKKAEKEKARVSAKVDELKGEQEQLATQKLEETQKKTAISLELEELKSTGKDSVASHKALTDQLADLSKDIVSAEKELETEEGNLKSHVTQEKQKEADIMQTEQRLQQLYQKQGRKNQFNSKKERDHWINNEIKEIDSALQKKEASLATLEAQHEQISKTTAEQEETIRRQREDIKSKEKEQDDILGALKEFRKTKGDLQEERKLLWKNESKLDKETTAARTSMQKKERQVDSSVARDIQNGLKSLQRIVQQHNIQGVHGPIIELFECKDTYNTAVEATAGNVLFHVVVDSDEVATRIISHLNRGNGGRLSFIPLNRIHAPRVNYPNQYGKDVIPLLKIVKHKPIYQKAMAHVFGRTLLCRTIDLASEVALSANLNCVTLDGDQASHKGSLTGGYYEERHSKLENMKQLKEIRSKFDTLSADSEKLKEDISSVDQKVSHALGEIQKEEAKYNRSKSEIQTLSHDLKTLVLQVDANKKQVAERETAIEDLNSGLRQLRDQHETLSSELGTDLVTQLSKSEQREIKTLNAQMKTARAELTKLQTERMEIETLRNQLATNLDSNLLKQRESLEKRLSSSGDPKAAEESFKEKEAELEKTIRTLKDIEVQAEGIEKEMESNQTALTDLEKEIDTCKGMESSDAAQDQAGELEKLTNKKQTLQHRRQELENKIRDLGSLPSDAFGTHGDKSKDSLLRLQDKVLKQLKKFSHVNKKALDQYMNFSEQRDEYSRRFKEQKREEAKISELINALDMQKDELLERTFKGVAREFVRTFTELVPQGAGELVMIRSFVQEGQSKVKRYSGVSCKVCFGGEETKKMEQLSGGQKTVVALALIFAIQRCDRAPFYLFDEIDAALDPQYRINVANIISRQANDGQNPTQFIQTTFAPELVNIADHVYGVTFKNKVSSVDLIDKEEGLSFLKMDNQPDQEVGKRKRRAR